MANIDKKLAAGETAVIAWSVEIETDRQTGVATAFLFGPGAERYYSLIPGIVPKPADGGSSSYEDAIVNRKPKLGREPGWGIAPFKESVRGQNDLYWFVHPVAPGDYTLAHIDEGARFAMIGGTRGFITPIGIPKSGGAGRADMILPPDTPTFKLAPGDAVYLGTFTGRIETKGGEVGTTRAETVSKSYALLPGDAVVVAERLKIKPDQVRLVDLFASRGRAWQQYIQPHPSDGG